MTTFAAARTAHRDKDVELGIRSAQGGVLMGHVMWAQWLQAAEAHRAAAEAEFTRIDAGDTSRLGSELRESMVAFAAAASVVDALCQDLEYLVPPRPRSNSADEAAADLLVHALGIQQSDVGPLKNELEELFGARHGALHAFSEMRPARAHPVGVATSWEHEIFNGPTATQAVLVALRVLAIAEAPPQPANRWIARWITKRERYFTQVVAPIRSRVLAQD